MKQACQKYNGCKSKRKSLVEKRNLFQYQKSFSLVDLFYKANRYSMLGVNNKIRSYFKHSVPENYM
jgi:hypothetical protein